VNTTVDDPIGIVELVEVCERFAERNRLLFGRLGVWVADEPDPSLQRWFAIAAHRHAWHAELWDDRRPTIPVTAPSAPPPSDADADPGADPGGRAGWYRAAVASMRADLTELASRVDPRLDPSTRRVVDLVRADLDDLATQATLPGD
jgi:hypothetical protein